MFNDDNQSLFSNKFLLTSSKKPDNMTPESCEPLQKITEQPDMTTTVYQKFVNIILTHIYKITDKMEIEVTAQQVGGLQ